MPRPKSNKEKLQVHIEPEVIRQLDERSQQSGLPKSFLVEHALKIMLKQNLTINL